MAYNEKDTDLKLRLMRHLWNTGYIVRKNVGIKEFGESGEYTDVDVLGVKINQDLTRTLIICDCKTGNTPKTNERIFWLSGLQQYFKADHIIFLKSQMNTMKYYALAKKLNITLLSENELKELEKKFNTDNLPFFNSFDKNQPSIENSFQTLKKHSKDIHDYLRKGFWLDETVLQIATLIKCCTIMKKFRSFPVEPHQFSAFYCLSELAISLIEFSRNLLSIPPDYHENFITMALHGGKNPYEDKKNTIQLFYKFMVKEIKKRYNQTYPISQSEFVENFLIRENTKYIIDIISRIVANPISFSYVPKLLECMAHNAILAEKIYDLDLIFTTQKKPITQNIEKALTDFLIFAERANLLPVNIQDQKSDFTKKFFD